MFGLETMSRDDKLVAAQVWDVMRRNVEEHLTAAIAERDAEKASHSLDVLRVVWIALRALKS